MAVESLCLKVGWMEGGTVCRNGGPERERLRVRVGDTNGSGRTHWHVVLRASQEGRATWHFVEWILQLRSGLELRA